MVNHPRRSKKNPKYAPPSGEEIAALRRAHKLNPTSAAELVGVTTTRWREYEKGERVIHEAFWELFKRKLFELHEKNSPR